MVGTECADKSSRSFSFLFFFLGWGIAIVCPGLVTCDGKFHVHCLCDMDTSLGTPLVVDVSPAHPQQENGTP